MVIGSTGKFERETIRRKFFKSFESGSMILG
jgi:hypothetical protein